MSFDFCSIFGGVVVLGAVTGLYFVSHAVSIWGTVVLSLIVLAFLVVISARRSLRYPSAYQCTLLETFLFVGLLSACVIVAGTNQSVCQDAQDEGSVISGSVTHLVRPTDIPVELSNGHALFTLEPNWIRTDLFSVTLPFSHQESALIMAVTNGTEHVWAFVARKGNYGPQDALPVTQDGGVLLVWSDDTSFLPLISNFQIKYPFLNLSTGTTPILATCSIQEDYNRDQQICDNTSFALLCLYLTLVFLLVAFEIFIMVRYLFAQQPTEEGALTHDEEEDNFNVA